MHTVQVLTLLLALSGALNVAFIAGLTARFAGAGPAQAILTGAARRHHHGDLLRRRIRLPLTMTTVRREGVCGTPALALVRLGPYTHWTLTRRPISNQR